jgi:DNA adenine methylase
LNKTAYNGLYRVNSKGEFNVPFGRYYNPTIVPKLRILSASRVLKNMEIFCTDFSYVKDYANPGDLCYFDPPYHPISSTANFTSYSSNGFNFKDQKRLRDVCVDLDEKGVYFILSNAHATEIIDLYEEVNSFRIETVKANRVISSKASTRGPINEILVTNIPKICSIGRKLYQYREPLIYYHVN